MDELKILDRSSLAMFQRDPRAGVFLGGDRVSGQEIRDQNGQFNASLESLLNALRHATVTAALAISNIVKSSLGPLGLDKMLVDNIGVRLYHLHISG